MKTKETEKIATLSNKKFQLHHSKKNSKVPSEETRDKNSKFDETLSLVKKSAH